jgi:dolichol-phosphate mannosyltransferase
MAQNSQSTPSTSTVAELGIGRVLVVVPTYNEAENVRIITERLRNTLSDVDLLIADDNSPDGTGKIADELAETDSRVHVLHRAGKQGLGAAYVAGFRWAIEQGYDVVVEMDADGSHAPEQLPLLLAQLSEADLVLGSRWVAGGKVVNWPKSREILSRGGNLYTRLMLGIPLRDATAGFRAYRREVLEAIELDSVASQGYCFQVDLTRRTIKAGFRIAEVPITFVDRERGQSNMSSAIVREALWKVTVWGFQDRWAKLRHRANK